MDGKTRTLFIPSDRQAEVEKWISNWKELKEIISLISECQRAQFRLEEEHDAIVKKAGVAVANRRKRLTKLRRTARFQMMSHRGNAAAGASFESSRTSPSWRKAENLL